MIQEAILLSQQIRAQRPDLPLVWGGPHPTIMPELTANHFLVDIVCYGEGERTAVNLAKALAGGKSLEKVSGIVFKKEGHLVVNPPVPKIPIKDADVEISLNLQSIDLEPYIFLNRGKKTAIFITSRGCPYRCNFCWNLMFHKRRYMAWSPEKTTAEIEPFIKKGVQRVLLFDSFLGSMSRVVEIGKIFQKARVEWAIEDGCRVDYHNTPTFFQMLEETGCTHVAFGAESGSQRVLDLIRKDISVEDILTSAEVRKPFKIAGRYQWMTGIPGETKEDALMTVELIDHVSRINPMSAHSFELYLPYPGNELFELACASGWKPPQDLPGWGTFRWEGRYPYHQEGTWFYKALQYSNFFYRRAELAKLSAFTAQIRPIFQVANWLLWPFAMLRWKSRFFEFPAEYWLAESLRGAIEK
jgi:radical SAM superfamily enzyme YgiQ (UPF0313 family)